MAKNSEAPAVGGGGEGGCISWLAVKKPFQDRLPYTWGAHLKPTAKLNQLLNYIFLPMEHNAEKNIHLQMHSRCPSPLQAQPKNKHSINMSFLLEKKCPNYTLFTAEN